MSGGQRKANTAIFVCIIIGSLVLSGCIKQQYVVSVIKEIENAAVPEIYIDPVLSRAEEIVSMMSDRLLAAQVLISGVDGSGNISSSGAELLKEIPAGGIMLFRYNLNTDNESIRGFLSQITELIGSESGIIPFIAVDHEGGTVNRFRQGVASLPSAVSYWELSLDDEKAALEKIGSDSFNAGLEIKSLGFSMNFAPVAEHLTDDNRIFLARRSYGPDPDFTARAALAFVQGMEKAGIICVIKHFPGSAGQDPHYSKSILNLTGSELDTLASPFTYLIKYGARAIMAAHTLIPALDSEIASLSPVVMRNWLREGLGFNGIIISDDFIMAAAGGLNPEDAAVKSIAAGSDMILVWPADLRKTHAAIIKALENETLLKDRLKDAAVKIIYEKLKYGLMD